MAVTNTVSTPQQIQTPQITPDNTQGTSKVSQQGTITGSGINGINGPAPQPPVSTDPTQLMQALFENFPPSAMSSDQMTAMVASVESKLKQVLDKDDDNEIQTEESKKTAALSDQMSSLKDAEQKIQKAEYDQAHESIWDKIKMAFEALGAALSIVIGAVLVATGVAAAAGALMIVAGVVGLVMVANEAVTMATGEGIMGHLVKAFGGSQEQQQKADEGFGYAMAGVGIVLSVAMFFVPGAQAEAVEGAVNDVMDLSEAGEQLANTGEDASNVTSNVSNVTSDVSQTTSDVSQTASDMNTATKVSQQSQFAASRVQTTGNVVNTVSNLGSAGSQVASSVYSYEASNDQADAKTDTAKSDTLQAAIKSLDNFIDMLIQHMGDTDKAFTQSTSSLMDSLQDTFQTMVHAKI